jgi:FtsZ-interacting cell division protein YlmF
MGRVKLISKTPKVILYRNYEDLENILNLLKDGEEVIVNISLVDIKTSYRIIDFVSGFVMAFNGKRKKIENKIYSFKI